MKARVWVRVVVALLALWYAALGIFKLAHPACSAGGFDFSRVVCVIDGRDYGPIYHEVVMFSFLALAPLAVTMVILLVVLETRLHERTSDG